MGALLFGRIRTHSPQQDVLVMRRGDGEIPVTLRAHSWPEIVKVACASGSLLLLCGFLAILCLLCGFQAILCLLYVGANGTG